MYSSIYINLLVYESVEIYVININDNINKDYTTLQNFCSPKRIPSTTTLSPDLYSQHINTFAFFHNELVHIK